MSDIQWDFSQIEIGLQIYEAKVMTAVRAVADYLAPVMEAYAKGEAPWTDRTANARQSLHAWVEEEAAAIVDIYLSHGMEYGKYLEFRRQGRYAIIFPTLEAHFVECMKRLEEIFA